MTRNIISDLGDGLIIRHASEEDAQALAQFNKEIHGEDEWDGKGVHEWTLDLVEGRCPLVSAQDFTIVEDTTTAKIISSCCFISQTWTYEGIPFKVGRPELVGTSEAYRRQGLVRQQFEIMHQWSKDRGELVQSITGIPYYYRQFGYEMTVNLDGGRAGTEINLPKLPEGEIERFHFRLSTAADIPFLMTTEGMGSQRDMIAAVRDEALWRYEVMGLRKFNINRRDLFVIENEQGIPVGVIAIPPIKWGNMNALTLFEISQDASWADITPSVIRFLWQRGLELAKDQNQEQKQFGFWLGESHPAYEVAASMLPRVRSPYAFYIRVTDLLAFLRLIQPALERRLAQSAFANHTGELKLSFYRGGIALKIQKGEIIEIKPLSFKELGEAHAAFPQLTHLHLIFGHRSMAELQHAFADCYTKNEETKHLLDSLFPKKPSNIWVIS
jgi:predicted N-acetyltransferase YhbS